jgi:hypothetical protein
LELSGGDLVVNTVGAMKALHESFRRSRSTWTFDELQTEPQSYYIQSREI